MIINKFSRKYFRFSSLIFILFIYVINAKAYKQENIDDEFIDIGVRLTDDNRDTLIADLIAEEKDVLNAGRIDGVDLYHFRILRQHNRRSKRALEETVEDLKRDERIESVTIGEELERQKREFLYDDKMENRQLKYKQRSLRSDNSSPSSKSRMSFDDVLYPKQWYLENTGQLKTPPNNDLNAAPAWLAGYSGRGIVISIVDDGLDHPHPDIVRRYKPKLSYDLNDLNDPEHDPLPRTYDNQNSHGTRCAGAAAGEADNGVCGVGVAYNADIAAIRLLDGRITTLLEARALTLFAAETHIKSASWGPTDDGTKMEAPGGIVNTALDYAVTHGRHGKGTLFVWASGNGGAVNDDCGADGYVSHPSVISIGSINHMGNTVYFGEDCPSTMAVTYTGGMHSTTTRENYLAVGVVAADVGGKCTTSFFGTSAAAPVAAGSLALVLEANPNLTYRDVMYIIAETARIPTLSETDGWLINGAGYHVNDKFGFGVLDAGQMTALAQNWTNVEELSECYQEYKGINRKLGIGAIIEVSLEIDTCTNITIVEHVTANISYSFHRRGDVKITIISPSKTPSEVLSYRKNDATDKGIDYFPFTTVHSLGETPMGKWTLLMETREPQNTESEKSAAEHEELGELRHFGLRIYGTHKREDKNYVKEVVRSPSYGFVPTKREIESIFKRELAARQSPNVIQKRNYQDLLKERETHKESETETKEDRSLYGLFRRAFSF